MGECKNLDSEGNHAYAGPIDAVWCDVCEGNPLDEITRLKAEVGNWKATFDECNYRLAEYIEDWTTLKARVAELKKRVARLMDLLVPAGA